MGLDGSQKDAIELVSFVTNILSLCGSLFIISNYALYKELRNMAGKLVFMIALSDCITEFASLFMTPSSSGLCAVQGLILQFGSIASVLWVGCISYTIYDIIVRKNVTISENQLWWYHVFVWTSTTLLTILPLTTGSYGESIGWCWVKEEKDIDSVWRILTWYSVLIVVILYSFYMYYKIFEEVGNNLVVQRMKYYPVVLFVCYSPGFIFRLQKINNNPSFTLGVMYSALKGIYGLMNALIFAFNNNVRKIWQKSCLCLPNLQENTTVQKEGSTLSISRMGTLIDDGSETGSDEGIENAVDLQVGTLRAVRSPLTMDSFSNLPQVNAGSLQYHDDAHMQVMPSNGDANMQIMPSNGHAIQVE